MNDYERKFQLASAELEYAGLQERGYPAPYIRFLRKVGFKPKPDFYRRTLSRLIWNPLVFGGLWGAAMYLLNPPPNCLIPQFVLVSLTFGVLMTLAGEIGVWRGRKRHNLSRWEDL